MMSKYSSDIMRRLEHAAKREQSGQKEAPQVPFFLSIPLLYDNLRFKLDPGNDLPPHGPSDVRTATTNVLCFPSQHFVYNTEHAASIDIPSFF